MCSHFVVLFVSVKKTIHSEYNTQYDCASVQECAEWILFIFYFYFIFLFYKFFLKSFSFDFYSYGRYLIGIKYIRKIMYT